MIVIKEVDALQESVLKMHEYEQKYGISSACFMNGDIGNISIEPRDERIWNFNIECFLLCGGVLDSSYEQCNQEEIIDNATETICTTSRNELIVKDNKEKGKELNPFLFSMFEYFLFYKGLHKIL